VHIVGRVMRLLGLAAVVALALPAAGHAQTVDRTVSCQVASVSGIPSVAFRAQLFKSSAGWWVRLPPGAADVLFVSTLSGPPGLKVDPSCAKAPSVPLVRGGLPRLTVLDPANNVVEQTCESAGRIVVRVHAVLRHGFSVSGEATVRTGAKLRPLLYVAWTAKQVAIYAAGDCTY
jgi:hypothetical protein